MSIWGLSWPWKTKKGRTVESYDKLPWQHMMFFGRDEEWDARQESEAAAKTDDGSDDG